MLTSRGTSTMSSIISKPPRPYLRPFGCVASETRNNEIANVIAAARRQRDEMIDNHLGSLSHIDPAINTPVLASLKDDHPLLACKRRPGRLVEMLYSLCLTLTLRFLPCYLSLPLETREIGIFRKPPIKTRTKIEHFVASVPVREVLCVKLIWLECGLCGVPLNKKRKACRRITCPTLCKKIHGI